MPLIALFIIAIVSWIVVQAGATAFMMTGLSRSVAEFQAISCFFGVGFTTHEAEMIVTHPVRRRIAVHLIVVGNIGLTSAVGAFIITFMGNERDFLDEVLHTDEPASFMVRLAVIILGVGLIAVFFHLGFVKRMIEWVVKYSLETVHAIRVMDYDTVLRSDAGFAVMQVDLDANHEYIGKTLAASQLGSKGVLILSILRAGRRAHRDPAPNLIAVVRGHPHRLRARGCDQGCAWASLNPRINSSAAGERFSLGAMNSAVMSSGWWSDPICRSRLSSRT